MKAMRGHVAGTLSAGDACGHVAEIVGTSDESVDAAIDEGVSRAVGPAEHVEWVEVTGVRSNVLGGAQRYRVGLRLGLRPAA